MVGLVDGNGFKFVILIIIKKSNDIIDYAILNI